MFGALAASLPSETWETRQRGRPHVQEAAAMRDLARAGMGVRGVGATSSGDAAVSGVLAVHRKGHADSLGGPAGEDFADGR